MKRCYCLVALACVFIISSVACSSEGATANISNTLAVAYEPLEIVSFEGISEAKKNFDAKNDIYKLNDLEFYYIPSHIASRAKLDAILIKESYVCIYYYLKDLNFKRFENPDEEEIERIENTIKLEWTRNADGDELLINTIKQLQLKQMDSNGITYYIDIYYPTEPERILAKSIYWVEDGYMFNLDVPIMLFNEEKEVGTEASIIAKLASVEKIAITTE